MAFGLKSLDTRNILKQSHPDFTPLRPFLLQFNKPHESVLTSHKCCWSKALYRLRDRLYADKFWHNTSFFKAKKSCLNHPYWALQIWLMNGHCFKNFSNRFSSILVLSSFSCFWLSKYNVWLIKPNGETILFLYIQLEKWVNLFHRNFKQTEGKKKERNLASGQQSRKKKKSVQKRM